MKATAVLVVVISVCSCQRTIVDPEGYIENIFSNVASQITKGPAQNILKLADFEEYFYTKVMDKTWNGTVRFDSGAVHRIGKFEMVYMMAQAWTDQEVWIRQALKLSDFVISFDVDCESDEYTTPSVLIFTFSFIELEMQINRNHFDKQIVPKVTNKSEGTFTVQNFPNNAYTQIFAKEINPSRGTTPLRTHLIESIRGWAAIFEKLVEKATKEVAFPELCHYCPNPPW